jgi:hypothetical protein
MNECLHIYFRSYSTGLQLSTDDQEKQTIRLNRALAHLKNGNFDAAIQDTDDLHKVPMAREKALYRMGPA